MLWLGFGIDADGIDVDDVDVDAYGTNVDNDDDSFKTLFGITFQLNI